MDEWRVEAYFSHLYSPVDWHKGVATKAEVYWRVGMALMAENIQKVIVYKNGVLHKTIVVEENNTSTS